MKTFINGPNSTLIESLKGFAAAHADLVVHMPDGNFICRKVRSGNKVAIISGGGSGHEPLHCGYVGRGMLDAACPGQIFTSPTPDQIIKAANEVGTNAGCIFIVKNYAGDIMNFEMASELMPGQNRTVIVSDDLAQGVGVADQRGVAGTLIVQKIIGAAAEQAMTLDQLFTLGTGINRSTRTMGLALDGSFNPVTKRKSLALEPGEIEFGVGIHGEPGVSRIKLRPADDLAAELCAPIIADLKTDVRHPALLFINGFGGTPLSELYVMYYAAHRILTAAGITIARSLVGNYVTSLNMSGCSISLCSMTEENLKLWDAPVVTPSLRWGA